MAMIRSCTASVIEALSDNWECAQTEAGAVTLPDQLPALDWLPAAVPGTYAAALRAAGQWNGEPPLELDQLDIWYRTRFADGADEILHFHGLATIADVWLNGRRILTSESMFLSHRVRVHTDRVNDLQICFRSLTAWLAGKHGRARWRPRLASPGLLRFARSTLLGRMPGWCPTVHPVGPWRPVLRERRRGRPAVESVDLRTSVVDGVGRIVVRAVLDGPVHQGPVVEIGGHSARLDRTGPNEVAAEIALPSLALWWPHTHGVPALHPLSLQLGEVHCDLGAIGLREVALDRGPDGNGFALRINGQTVFCRGACWSNQDIIALPGDDLSYRPLLASMRDGHMNMVRIGGTMLYEADDFYTLCDELGLLVWQEAMLANFDYPAGEPFRASLTGEITQFLDRTQSSPSIVVFCGGSEVLQQASMLGLPREKIDASLYTELLPDLVQARRPDILYVPNSPWGGEWPFLPETGVSHYYGVGAYLRPLDDARRANVRFASECLALANVPDAQMVQALGVATVTDPRWKRAVPRDPGAGWDFEDVRDHYLATLFEVDPTRLRWADFPRYLELSRAVSCLLIEHVFGEWRRVGSTCGGGLVWQLQDLTPGAGWGMIDAFGRPKAAWHAMRRAARPRQVILTDEGLNGLHAHVLNESAEPFVGVLRIACLRDGHHAVREAEVPIELPPRGAACHSSAAMLPGFFDITYAYRFGPRVHEVTVATLYDVRDALVAEAVHFPGGPNLPVRDVGLEATVERVGDDWWLGVRADSFASFVHLEDPLYRADDDWLHLPPGGERRTILHPICGEARAPAGEVRAVNADRTVRYSGRA